jgi:quinol monooxygenase YgiN
MPVACVARPTAKPDLMFRVAADVRESLASDRTACTIGPTAFIGRAALADAPSVSERLWPATISRMPLPHSELRLIAELVAKPSQADALRAALQAMLAPSRGEPGCLQYDLHEDRDREGHFMFFERWTDAAALDAHTKTPHYLALGNQVEPLLAAPPVLTKLKMI